MNESSNFMKEIPPSSLASSVRRGHRKKLAVNEPENGLSPDTKYASATVVDARASRTVRDTFLLFTSHLIYGILL